jgi:hypothetical protein
MSELNQTALQSLLQSATADLETIATMLHFIRDNVAPMISEFDLKNVAIRHSVRVRISPHPTLYRATMAAEAAYAAMRGTQSCISAAKALLPTTFARHSSEIAYAEAKYWERQAKEQIATITRAMVAISAELERIKCGKATIIFVPPTT